MWIIAELSVLASTIGFDLFSKWLVKAFLATTVNNRYAVIDGVLEFTYVENDGASFGIFAGNKWLLLGITVATALIIAIMLIIRPKAPKLLRYSLIVLLGGAIGNIYDRAMFGYVRDFIDYKFLDTWFGIDFAIGNIADIFCLVAVLMLFVYMLFGYREGDLAKDPVEHRKKLKAKNNG